MSTITALSAFYGDVVAAIASASDGDTVNVPAGSASWTSTLSLVKAITLQGASIVDSDTGVCTDLTIITDNVVVNPITQQASIIAIGGSNARVTGFTFQNGTQRGAENGAIAIGAGATHLSGISVDRCHFKPLWQSQYTTALGWVDNSVIKRNVMEFGSPTWKGQAFLNFQRFWNGADYGDGAFADDTNWGTNKFVVFENNYILNKTQYQTLGTIDSYFGGRYVCRYNKFFNAVPNSHGTEGAYRSSRAIEIYSNEFHCDPSYNLDSGQQVVFNMGLLRGGTALIYNNNYYGANIPSGMILQTYRSFLFATGGAVTPAWGIPGTANGANVHDLNATEADGTHVDGHSSYLFASGNVTAFNGTSTLTDSTKNWTTNQWVNYSITNTTNNHASVILSNTATTITYYLYPDFPAVFSVGHHYEIRRVLIITDQAGRGKSANAVTRDGSGNVTSTYPADALEPVYSWNNKHLATNTDINVSARDFNAITGGGAGQLLAGRDFINGTAFSYTPYTYPFPAADETDTTHPVVAITFPAAGDKVKDVITITATATDNVAVAGVTFKYNSTTIGAEDLTGVSDSYSAVWDTTGLTNGDYTLHAIARDTSNNTTEATTVLVSVDNAPPIIIVDPPVVKKKGEAEEGTTLIVTSTLSVEFVTQCPDTDYTFDELEVQNTTEMSPLILIPSLTVIAETGFTVAFNGTPDTSNYLLRWKITA